MEPKDVVLAGASLAIIIFFIILGGGLLLLIFALGSPLVLAGSLMAMGALGLVALFGLLVALLGAWYIVYAFLKTYMGGMQKEKPGGGNYTLGRLKKA